MKRLVQLACLFLIPTIAISYELNGSLFDYDVGNGTYTVVVQNEEGHEYIGSAVEKSDGTLVISVRDDKGDTYKGSATKAEDGYYNMDLKNTSTGNEASGELEED